MILVATEGKREEKLLSEILGEWGFFGDNVEVVVYGTNIHLLVEALKTYEDCDPEDIDITMLLREVSRRTQSDQSISENILNKKYSDVLLFFDMEPQHNPSNWEDVKALVKRFSADTTTEKLFINFPMFESLFLDDLKQISIESISKKGAFKELAHKSNLWRKFNRTLIKREPHLNSEKNWSKDDVLRITHLHKTAYKTIVGSEYGQTGIAELLAAEVALLREKRVIFCINSSILSVLDFGVTN